ncbi:MAG: sigma-70 family RNA polymerase sigma factor [Planctomycetes bacterium]|nr:sigma-70 family RNA polymerase sigma factor [Planctomycetota bacterium]
MEKRDDADLDPHELEAHRAWLRRLAQVLLRDPSQAEDCVQDVFVAALHRGPPRQSAEFSLRAWLRQVLVNRARKLGELDALRRHHEARALAEHRPEHPREPLELCELQDELQRDVQALEERYRNVVLLRHQSGLLPAEIAAHLHVPVKTVNSWLYRAYGKLRERLDRRYEGLGGWALLLQRATESSEARGGQGVGTGSGPDHPRSPRAARRPVQWAWAAAGLVLVAASARSWLSRSGPEHAPRAVDLAPAHLPGAASDEFRLPGTAPRAEPGRVAVLGGAPADAPTSAGPALSTEAGTWSGLVVDPDGVPVPDLRLRFEPLTESDRRYFNDHANAGFDGYQEVSTPAGEDNLDSSELSSGPDGTFVLPSPRTSGWIDVADDEWTLVTTSVALELPPITAARVQVARARRVAGRVFDRNGQALSSVRVETQLPERLVRSESSFPGGLAYEPSALTEGDGSFQFSCLADLPDVFLRFELDGYEPVEQRLDSLVPPLDALEVVLSEEAPGLAFTGRARDSRGEALAGVVLSFDWTSTATSDQEGRFRLRPSGANSPGRKGTLRAAARGFQPLHLSLTCGGEAASDIDLVFEAPALTLEGVVLRPDGTPHSNATVWLPAPTALVLPPRGEPPIFTEHVMGGPQDGGSIEATVTDAEGRFRLRGLQDRAYVVRLADLETREWFASEPLHPGQSDVLLEFPPDGCWPEVRGVVVGRDGGPITEAFVARSYPRLDVRMPDGRRYVSHFAGTKVAVDESGAFVLTDVARHEAVLTILGPALQTRHVQLDQERNLDRLRLVVGRPCRVVVERGAADFDRFSFCAEPGERFEFVSASRGVYAPILDATLAGERSPEYLVNDLARELVLWSGAREVARVSIALVPGELNVLRP